MLSLRLIGRRTPSTFRALSTTCSRQTIRPATRISLSPPTWSRNTPSKGVAAFSTSRTQRESESQGEHISTAACGGCMANLSPVNDELAAKIDSELAMEREMRDPDAFPAHLKEYIDNSPFTVQDSPGKEEVVLTRTYGDEKIRVAFSIDDLNNMDEDADQQQNEDNSIMDEVDDPADMPSDTQSGGANTKGSVNQGRTRAGNIKVAPEDSVAPADREELRNDEDDEEQEDQEPSFPSHCFITVERPNKGALQIEAIAQDGMMVIDNVFYYKDGKLAEPKTRQDEDAARDLYTGPPFGNLDEDLQLLFEKYLEERGINTTMALFIPEYIDYKEQKEYLSWLNGVRSFVE